MEEWTAIALSCTQLVKLMDGRAKKEEIVSYCFSKEQIIDKRAIELLVNEEHWKQILDEIDGSFISEESVRAKIVRHESKLGNLKEEIAVVQG